MVIPEVSSRAEEWLMSIVMSPDYQTTKHLFIAYAYTKGNAMAVRVVRLVDDPRTWITQDRIIMDNLPAARRHAGTALAFGPDGMLYITVWDAIAKDRAQSLVDYHGKTLRVTNEWAIPLDNPFSWSALWTYGHRNSQWIARTSSGLMYASEHWPSTFDGSPWWDEINRIIPWENYGWPLVSHEGIGSGFRAPLAVYTPALAPSSLYIHDGSWFPQWNDHLFVGLLRGEGILVVRIDSSDPDRVVEQFRLVDNRYGRIRFVWAGPAGSILFTTSNEDGRWTSSPHKDKLYQIRPLPLTIRQ
jgi:glucose/arabinose dehydrogenase